MPFVDQDIKLDFKDVLFRPKRSSLKSRSQVQDNNRHTCRLFIIRSGRVEERIQIPKFWTQV